MQGEREKAKGQHTFAESDGLLSPFAFILLPLADSRLRCKRESAIISAMSQDTQIKSDPVIEAMFGAGAHYGYSKGRRHPSTQSFVFGAKNGVEIVDLEKTKSLLENAELFLKNFAAEGKSILIVGTKKEAQSVVKEVAEGLGLNYVDHRWIGGTLTNWNEIKKRLLRLEDLSFKKEKGELNVYTKRERGMIDREIADLEMLFGGISGMRSLPHAIIIIDPREENTAVKEAIRIRIPVIALASTDCDLSEVDYPVVANDSAKASIRYFLEKFARAISLGKAEGVKSEVTAPKPEEKA